MTKRAARDLTARFDDARDGEGSRDHFTEMS